VQHGLAMPEKSRMRSRLGFRNSEIAVMRSF